VVRGNDALCLDAIPTSPVVFAATAESLYCPQNKIPSASRRELSVGWVREGEGVETALKQKLQSTM